MIRAIQKTTGAKIDVDDSGRVSVFGPDGASVEQAMAMVTELTQEAEIGHIYLATVKRHAHFGVFSQRFSSPRAPVFFVNGIDHGLAIDLM